MLGRSLGADIYKIRREWLFDYPQCAEAPAGCVSGLEWAQGYFKKCESRYARIVFDMALLETRAALSDEIRKRRLRRLWKCLRQMALAANK